MAALIGCKDKFAIQFEILDVVENWILGTFIFWINGLIVGDPDDKSVDLKGCMNWLQDFINSPRNRFEPELYDMDKEQAFFSLCTTVISGNQDRFNLKEKYKNTFSRFHISHLGMSSFDRLNILLIENDKRQQRCIWQQADEEIKEAFFEAGEIEKVSSEAIIRFSEDLARRLE